MTRKRRAVAVSVVLGAAVIAACLGPHLSSTGSESVVANPPTVEFGTISTGSTSLPQRITISPAGSGEEHDVVTAILYNCTDFTVVGPINWPVYRECSGSGSGSNCVVQLGEYDATFHPVVAGSASCTVMFAITGSSPQTVTLRGNGASALLAIEVSPEDVGFGDQRVSTTSNSELVTAKNVGTQPLTISSVSISQTTPGVFQFSSGPTSPHMLGPGLTDNFRITCTPPATLQYSGTLTIMSNATNEPVAMVPLSCRGTNSELDASPSVVDLDTRVDDPIDGFVTITNSGSADANITALTVTGHPELTFVSSTPLLPITLPNGSNATVRVRFAAATPRPKMSLGKLVITHEGLNDEVVLSAEALATSISVNPDTVDFGPICAGGTASLDVNVFANAAGDFQLSMITPPAPPFSLTPKPGTGLPDIARGGHGNDLSFAARVMPPTAGTLSSKAVLQVDVPNMPVRDVNLRAEALPAGVNATPRSVDFGSVQRDTTTPVQRVQLTNCGSGPLMVTGAHVEGPAANEFAIVSPATLERTLAPTEGMELLLVMTPRSAGAKVGTLVIEHAVGASTAELVGTALGPGDNEGERRETYYRCSAGGRASSMLPVVVALAFVRRRRRRSPGAINTAIATGP